MNIIAIDPSLTCTAMVINGMIYVYAKHDLAYTSKNSLTKWFDEVDDKIYLRTHSLINSNQKFIENDILKIKSYNEITSNILRDIYTHVRDKTQYKIVIEGYSYSSVAGHLIDLVSFGTLLRTKLLEITDDIQIVPPSTLKLESCKFTYETTKKVCKNNNGVSGGSFKKHDIFKALVENKSLDCTWVNYLRKNEDKIYSGKNIPKPIEDINDAKIMYEIFKNRQ